MSLIKHVFSCGDLSDDEKDELVKAISKYNKDKDKLDANIAWADRNHEDHIFYDRITVFLLAETMLFIAYSALFGQGLVDNSTLLILSMLGLVLTLIWILVNIRQVKVLKHISFIASELIPTYHFIKEMRKNALPHSTRFLSCFVPSVFGLTWLYLILRQLFCVCTQHSVTSLQTSAMLSFFP